MPISRKFIIIRITFIMFRNVSFLRDIDKSNKHTGERNLDRSEEAQWRVLSCGDFMARDAKVKIQ